MCQQMAVNLNFLVLHSNTWNQLTVCKGINNVQENY